MRLVTVQTFFSPAEAHLVKARLEVAGFVAVVTGETAALTLEGYTQAAGGIRVQVPEGEAAEAIEFLAAE